MSKLKFINTVTGEIVEEEISGCSCKSRYKRSSDYKNIDNLSVKELNKIISDIKTIVTTKVISIDKEVLNNEIIYS